ncbi:MAG TPA: amidohydrolase family protein, partial [Rariglobus sp.]
SADVMGVADKIGSLAAGKFADFLVIDPTELGVVFDPYATLVFAGGGEHVQSVYVGGVAKVEAGKLLGQDWERIGGEVTRRVREAKPAPAGSGEGH